MISFVKKGYQQKPGDEKYSRVDLNLYIWTLGWVSVWLMSKRLQGFSIFRVVYEKLLGVFFQRAEGKLEPDSLFN